MKLCLEATEKMRNQKGERVLSEKARAVSQQLSSLQHIDNDDVNSITDLFSDMFPDIWYKNTPVSYGPVKFAVVTSNTGKTIMIVKIYDFITTDGVVSFKGIDAKFESYQMISSQIGENIQPATPEEVTQFVNELCGVEGNKEDE